MDLIAIKNDLVNRFTIFNTREDVKQWLKSRGYTWITKNNNNTATKKIQEYVKEEINNRLETLKKEISVKLLEENVSITTYMEENQDIWGSMLGGGGIAALTLLVEGAIFWPAAIICAAVGFFLGKDKMTNDFADSVLSSCRGITRNICEKLEPIIDDLIEESTKTKARIPKIASAKSTTISERLTYEQREIKDFLEQRNIKYLVHFTSGKNVGSIKKYGILSVRELNNRNYHFSRNDDNRLDNMLNYISLSVSKPNRIVLKRFIDRGMENPHIIYIDASILYKEIGISRFYCDRNAAASSCQKSSTIDGFKKMFAQTLDYQTFSNAFSYNRTVDGRENDETTDPQAEILFCNCVAAKYIVGINPYNNF